MRADFTSHTRTRTEADKATRDKQNTQCDLRCERKTRLTRGHLLKHTFMHTPAATSVEPSNNQDVTHASLMCHSSRHFKPNGDRTTQPVRTGVIRTRTPNCADIRTQATAASSDGSAYCGRKLKGKRVCQKERGRERRQRVPRQSC